jgi:hypothetical protein
MNTGSMQSFDIVYRMPKPDLYLFVSKFRTTFAKYKEKRQKL